LTALREISGRGQHALETLQAVLRRERLAAERYYRDRQSYVANTVVPPEMTVSDIVNRELEEIKSRVNLIEEVLDATRTGWFICFRQYRWYNVLRSPLQFFAFRGARQKKYVRLLQEYEVASLQLESKTSWLISPAGRELISRRMKEGEDQRQRLINEIKSAKHYLQCARAEMIAFDAAIHQTGLLFRSLEALDMRPDIINGLYFLPARLDAKKLTPAAVLEVLKVVSSALGRSDDFQIIDANDRKGEGMPKAELLFNVENKPALLVAHADPIGVVLRPASGLVIELSDGPSLALTIPTEEMGLLSGLAALDIVILSGGSHALKSLPIAVEV
jgi:hypothetical protein